MKMLTYGTHWLCVEPILLFTHECRPVHRSNTIVKFVDAITVIGLIATMRKLTEKGYSTRSHDALKLTCCSTSLWWDGEKEAHITSSTWMGWLSSVSPVSSSWGPTSCPGPPTSPAWSRKLTSGSSSWRCWRRTTWTFTTGQLRVSQQNLSGPIRYGSCSVSERKTLQLQIN